MHYLAVRWIAQPRVLHPYPERRFAVRYLRQEPYALMSARTGLSGGYRATGIPTAITRLASESAGAATLHLKRAHTSSIPTGERRGRRGKDSVAILAVA